MTTALACGVARGGEQEGRPCGAPATHAVRGIPVCANCLPKLYEDDRQQAEPIRREAQR